MELIEITEGIFQYDLRHAAETRYSSGYIIRSGAEAVIIETGAASSAHIVLGALSTLGISRKDVRFIIVTHIHLDHAGAAGVLAGVLPRAFVVVHPRGARHLADPARLREGVKAVYGEEVFGRVFEPVLPVPRERIIEGADGLELRTGGKILKIIDAPGHAYHHFIVHAPTDSAVFTGDAAGLTFSAFLELGLEFSMPTTSPTQFNPQKMKATMARIAALDPKHLLLTHYGAARDPQALLSRNIGLIDTYMRLWEESLQSGAPADWKRVEEALRSFHLDELEALGVPRDHPAHRTVFLDYEINAKGIVHHLMESRDVTSRIR